MDLNFLAIVVPPKYFSTVEPAWGQTIYLHRAYYTSFLSKLKGFIQKFFIYFFSVYTIFCGSDSNAAELERIRKSFLQNPGLFAIIKDKGE